MTQNWIRDVYLIAYARDEFGGYTYRIPSKTVDVEKTEPIHFDFNLVLNKKTTTNFCQIKIYNLEENTRALLYTDTAQAIELYAGYKDDAGLLFRGNVINIQHYHLKTDWITEIYVADGFKELNQTPYIKNWKSGTSIQKIINNIADTMGIPILIQKGSNPSGTGLDTTILYGISFESTCKNALDIITSYVLYDWTIQNGSLDIYPKDEPFNLAISYNLSTDNNIIGLPIVTGYVDKKNQTKIGLKVKTLLNANIKVGSIVNITAPSVQLKLGQDIKKKKNISQLNTDGTYIVESIKSSGSNYSNNFYMDLDLIAWRQK